MSEPIIVELTVEAHPASYTEEIDRDTWDAMTRAERGRYLQSMADTAVANAGGYGYQILSGATDADVE